MKKMLSIIGVLLLSVAIAMPAYAQAKAAKKKINLDAANLIKASEILKQNREFFSNPENMKTFANLVEGMNKNKQAKASKEAAKKAEAQKTSEE